MFFALPRLKVDLRGIRHDISHMTSQIPLPEQAEAAFSIGDVVRHRIFDFRGVVFDIDPVFANSDAAYVLAFAIIMLNTGARTIESSIQRGPHRVPLECHFECHSCDHSNATIDHLHATHDHFRTTYRPNALAQMRTQSRSQAR